MDARRDERFDSDLTITLERGQGAVRNVSAGGLYFVTGVALKAGESIHFTLEFSGPQLAPIGARCTARVVRIEPKGMLKGVGAAFESIELHRLGPPGR